jgi:hypothetical protein
VLISSSFPDVSTIDSHHTIKCQSDQIAKQSVEIQTLQDKINEVENRIEEHEQYSRRASLRFNNVSAPVDNKGQIIILVTVNKFSFPIAQKPGNSRYVFPFFVSPSG